MDHDKAMASEDNPWVRNDPRQGAALRSRPRAKPLTGPLLALWWILAALAAVQAILGQVVAVAHHGSLDIGLLGTCAVMPGIGLVLVQNPRLVRRGTALADPDAWQRWYRRCRQAYLLITVALLLGATSQVLRAAGAEAAWATVVPAGLFGAALVLWVVSEVRDRTHRRNEETPVGIRNPRRNNDRDS